MMSGPIKYGSLVENGGGVREKQEESKGVEAEEWEWTMDMMGKQGARGEGG